MAANRVRTVASRVLAALAGASALAGPAAVADIVAIDCHFGAEACLIAPDQAPLPNPVRPDPNNGILLLWREQQNVLLTHDLRINRALTQSDAFLGGTQIRAGTVVSSYYVQWDPSSRRGRVSATLYFDDTVAAAITQDQELFASDAMVGLPGLDYADFTLRGLEPRDQITFHGTRVDIQFEASSPGDWVRLITFQTEGSIQDNLAQSCAVTVAVPTAPAGGTPAVLPPADQRLAELVARMTELFSKDGPAPRIHIAAGIGAAPGLAEAVQSHLIQRLGLLPDQVQIVPAGRFGPGCTTDPTGAPVVALTVVPPT